MQVDFRQHIPAEILGRFMNIYKRQNIFEFIFVFWKFDLAWTSPGFQYKYHMGYIMLTKILCRYQKYIGCSFKKK